MIAHHKINGLRQISRNPFLVSHLLAVWLLLPWVRIGSRPDAVRAGFLWLGLTVAFEFLAGHYLFKKPWPVLFADYNLAAGRVWVIVPVTTFLSPFLAGLARGVFRGPGRSGS